ncbi:hypothetical protein [Paenibacillus herberti]|uniref:Uncharacterized protein n=1 Tax=Paenibacillus herberti TaxID=1619309 RepID=A0A229NUP0_9BACL|nr:hypothetical protein [Paenibacillus herberti]OXM13602.1 hypothetical protein CGZ75_21490 [Paenibacillus herberti]
MLLIYFAITIAVVVIVLLKLEANSAEMRAAQREQLKVSREILKQLEAMEERLRVGTNESAEERGQ